MWGGGGGGYGPVDGPESFIAFLNNHQMSLPSVYPQQASTEADKGGVKAASGCNKLSYVWRKWANKNILGRSAIF